MADWKDEVVNEGAVDDPTVIRKEWTDNTADEAEFTSETAPVHGKVSRVTTIPDEDVAPDDYNLVINDSDGVDILAGQGAGRSGDNPGQILMATPVSVLGTLTVAITGQANAGAKGKVVIYIDKE